MAWGGYSLSIAVFYQIRWGNSCLTSLTLGEEQCGMFFVNIWCSDIIVGVVMMHLSCVRQTFVNISYESYILYIVEIYVYVWLFCSHSSDCRQNIIYSIIKNDIVKSMIRLFDDICSHQHFQDLQALATVHCQHDLVS